MVNTAPRIWYVCDKCREWFIHQTRKCPECKEGNLIKTCAFCGEKFENCRCSKEELDRRCHKCGYLKEDCKCR